MVEENLNPTTDPTSENNKTGDTGQSPYLIVGLGNAGRSYRNNRHNIGFLLLDRLASNLKVTFSRMRSNALTTDSLFESCKVILAKPQSYMNLSGFSVSSLVRFYKVSIENILIVYDDVDLPLGKMRLRPFGGSAGQKGMQSIIKQLGTQDFPRMRLGIGRPPGRMETANYVLQDFNKDDREILEMVLDQAVEAALLFISSGLDDAMNKFNQLDLDGDL